MPYTADLGDHPSVVRALINILEDNGLERQMRDDTHRAVLNMLDDFVSEKTRLDDTQRATMNVLEDFEVATVELQRVNRELTHLDELKTEFVAMASHELRTPLTSITGFSATMLQQWDVLTEADKFKFVGIIDTQSQRLMRMVESLLTVSRIESGALKTTSEAINVSEAITQTLRDLDAATFDVTCAGDLSVAADADHVQQVLVNLISNAIKHGAAPFAITVTADAAFVEIRVVDHGPGVPAAFAPSLFQRFSQADQDPSRCAQGGVGRGTGLGLSIVRALVKAQGGDVWHEAGEPSGSRFVVRLPRVAT